MRTLLAVLLVAVVGLPAAASDCGTGQIEWVGTTPVLTRTADGIRFDIVGHYINYTIDGEAASVEVPESAESVTVCADGVTFGLGEPTEREPVPAQSIEDIDADTWQAYHAAGVYPL